MTPIVLLLLAGCRPDDAAPPDGEETAGTDSRPVDDSGSEPGVDTDPRAIVLDAEADAKLVPEDDGIAQSGDVTVAGAGDVDGDGVDDILVGMPDNDWTGGNASGTVYLVRGPVSGTMSLGLADALLLGSNDEAAGMSVAGAGDVNADGYPDILIGAPKFDSNGHIEGQAYLVNGPVSGSFPLSGAAAILHGDESACSGDGGWDPCETGQTLAGLGDMDGDGFDDILVGAPRAWAAYLLRGPVSGRVELRTEADVIIRSDDYTVGDAVAGGGDLDGDGLADAALVLRYDVRGRVVVFCNPPDGVIPVAEADAEIVDEGKFNIGESVSIAGDTDGDGHSDLLVSAGGGVGDSSDEGGALLFLGPLGANQTGEDANAAFYSPLADDEAGSDVAVVGDVDGDHHDDVLIGASGGYYGPGRAYLVKGPFGGILSLADADYHFEGDKVDMAGDAVSGAGDVDADGLADVLIAGPYDDEGGEYAGAAWLMYGRHLP